MRTLLLLLMVGTPAFQEAPSPWDVPPDTSRAVLQGQLLSAERERPLAYAHIMVRNGEGVRSAMADERGRYRVESVRPGRTLLRVTALAHEPLEVEVEVPPSGSVDLDLSLDVRPLALPALVATVSVEPARPRESWSLIPGARGERRTEHIALESGPGLAELAAGAGGGRPGVDPRDPSSVLYVRGAGSDLKLVLLDGAPVYAPFHLGGLIDAFQPGILGSSRLYVGGAPARYEGGLSYVLDLELRNGRGDRFRTAGAADVLAARMVGEGPVGPGTVLLGFREVHGAAVSEMAGGDGLPYGYTEGLARFDLPVGADGELSATGFWNRETVRLEGASPIQGEARWGNEAASLRYADGLAGGRLEVTAASGHFRTRLPSAEPDLPLLEGSTRRRRIGVDYSRPARPSGGMGLAVGANLDLLATATRGRDSLVTGTSETAWRSDARSLGGYAEATWSPTRDVELRTGLRSDLFLPSNEVRVSPRARLAWELEPGRTLTLAVGRFAQHLRAAETILASDVGGASPDDLASTSPGDMADAGTVPGSEPLPAEERALRVAGATHLAVGFHDSFDERLGLGLEGHLKVFDDFPGSARVRSSGADLWVQRAGESFSVWVGYSLAWVWTESTAADEDRFVGRQTLTGGANVGLGGGIRGGIRLAYGAGLPFTPVPADDVAVSEPLTIGGDNATPDRSADRRAAPPPLAGAPDGSYLRLDASLERSWVVSLGSVDGLLTPYLRVLNALDRRDALFYHVDPTGENRPASLAALPLLPVLGVEWSL